MSEYTNSIYEAILAANKKSGNGRRNILKTVPTNTYLVRLIPNAEDPSKTFTKYYIHGWKSPSTGKYTQTVCPSTYGEECPICNERFRLWNKGDEESKEESKRFARKERFYANVYVIDDPENSDNNGTVKIYGYGRQIETIINEALEGDDKDEFGARIIDFSDEGCNLRIKVEKNQAGFPNYTKSKFMSSSDVDVDIDTVLEQAHDFTPLMIRKTKDELLEMLHDGIIPPTEETASAPAPAEEPAPKVKKPAKKADDDIPMDFKKESKDESAPKAEDDDFFKELENLGDE